MRSSISGCHWSCCSPPGVPKLIQGLPSRSAMEGLSVVRGRLPGARVLDSPSSSQNIWQRDPRQKPSSGIAGEDCSHPADGVAETIFPQRSIISIWQVSPPEAPKRETVGSPVPAAARASSPRRMAAA